MRPLTLSIEGFTSFREVTTVDFRDADYFALVGPTGSGKSSLIDAIAFALYGSVPRYDDRRLVAPIITQGRTEARVGLDFAVGADQYRVVRVVRAAGAGRGRGGGVRAGARRPVTSASKGATTKEARLERLVAGGADGETDAFEVLAGDADGVTAAVSALLGLSFEHFIKCVVLPQGAFARFLHDKPSARQDLLVELLGLGIYAELGQRANQEAAAATNRAALAEQQLARPPVSEATPSALAEATARLAELRRLQDDVVAAEPVLATLADRQAEAESAARAAEARGQLLAAVLTAAVDGPDGVDQLGVGLRAATAEVAAADAAVALAEQRTGEAEALLADLAPRASLEAAWRVHEDRDGVAANIEKGQRLTASLVATEAELAAEMEAATAALVTARQQREALLHAHQAASLTERLVAGAPCPVCLQVVNEVPVVAPLLDLDAAAHTLLLAEKVAEEAAGAHQEAVIRRAKGEEKLASLVERLATLDAALTESPDRRTLGTLLATVDDGEKTLASARQAERAARSHLREMTERLSVCQREAGRAWERFDGVRDAVAALGPPSIDRSDLPAAWETLVAWAQERRPQEDEASSSSLALVAQLVAERGSRLAALVASCRQAGVDAGPAVEASGGAAGGRPLGEILAGALAAAEAEVARRQTASSEAERLRADLVAAREEARLAHLLGQHLKSSGFEKWLLDEVLAELVSGATALLRELSSGAYSLTLDDSAGFAVIDHRNADLVRSARTLSGGETFLASVALALALADRLAGFAAEGAAPLEAIFLDEGFGTLDPDTLDTVAAAIENLAADGRVVGLITHVRDLADRIPVRFEVEKGPTTSTVRRVEG
jgi:exonuclease SbcC